MWNFIDAFWEYKLINSTGDLSSTQLIKIAKGDKKRIFVKTHCVQDAGAEINSVRVIVTYAVVAFT